MKKRLFAMAVCMLMVLSCFVSVSAENAEIKTVASFAEADDYFFYPFNGDGEWTKSKLSLAQSSLASFRSGDGIRESGMLQLKNDASMGAISAGVNGIKMQADKNLILTGNVRYENYESLVGKHMYLQAYLTGLKGAPLYTDEACTEASGEATGGFVTAKASVDVNGAALGDGAWHTFAISIPTKGVKHSTGAYVDLTGLSVNLWFRPYAGNAFTATTDYFTQEFLDACAAKEETPYAQVLLDDFEGYFAKEADVETYHKTKTSLFYNFNSADIADTTSLVGKNANRAFLESY
ncbi:MAG: hypothetical protein IJ367_04080, partial [Clostridia bacterium]|nr:hypothetical protein [Clostridia bacterium]